MITDQQKLEFLDGVLAGEIIISFFEWSKLWDVYRVADEESRHGENLNEVIVTFISDLILEKK